MHAADTPPEGATGCLVLADGTVFWGRGFGAEAALVGEICFNTGMTGYQETLTDPSYAGQIITFTFPHIGNVGTNIEDIESLTPAARGLIVKQDVTEPANYRSTKPLRDWLVSHGIPGLAGIDTRALTARIRDGGPPNGVVCHRADGRFDIPALRAQAAGWPGLEGMDLAKEVTTRQTFSWDETEWAWPEGFGRQDVPRCKVVAVDYGAKRNILRCLASAGCAVTVVPASATAEEILAHKPDGVFLSNGPGDPAATGVYAIPAIQGVLAARVPVFGICLGHQLLALALGARTYKLSRGHRGANQPVKDLATGKVEITSQNHGFAVDPKTLPANATVTHVSLFDGTNEGIAATDRPAFSVQYHPEASPGPTDSHHLFHRFVTMIEAHKAAAEQAAIQEEIRMFDLTGRAALVTGGNGGIGLGFARGLAKAGASVMVAGRNAAKNAAAVAELTALGARADSVEVDVTNEASIRAMVATTAERLGRLDILVNNAGTNIRNRPELTRMEDWHAVLSTNLTSGMIAAQAAYPFLKAGGVGRVINNGSMLSIFGLPFHAAYGASKGGVVQMTKSMAVAWAADRITVNVILPGWIDTDLTRKARVDMANLNEDVLRRSPVKRWGTPGDFEGVAAFLASDAAAFITGVAIPVDGGFSVHG